MDDDDDYYEVNPVFCDCTCEHEPEEHGWGQCDAVLANGEDCPCEGGWEE